MSGLHATPCLSRIPRQSVGTHSSHQEILNKGQLCIVFLPKNSILPMCSSDKATDRVEHVFRTYLSPRTAEVLESLLPLLSRVLRDVSITPFLSLGVSEILFVIVIF